MDLPPVVIEPNVVDPNTDLRSPSQRACDKLPACDSSWCDIGGCEIPCELLELLSVFDGCDAGCL